MTEIIRACIAFVAAVVAMGAAAGALVWLVTPTGGWPAPPAGTECAMGPSRQARLEGNSDRVVGLLRGSPKGVVR
jgi:hypothetical protein